MQQAPYIARGSFDYRPFPELWHGATTLMKLAEMDPLGSAWKCTGALMMIAFAVEGYANTEGQRIHGAAWLAGKYSMERAPIRKKLQGIAQTGGLLVDFDIPPWTAIDTAFNARDQLAHPKPSIVQYGPVELFCHPDDIPDAFAEACMSEHDKLRHVEHLRVLAAEVLEAVKTIHMALHQEDHSLMRHGARLTGFSRQT